MRAIRASGSVSLTHSSFDSRLPVRWRSRRIRSSAVGVPALHGSLRHPLSGRDPQEGEMRTETTASSEVALGRGGRMSRRRKRDAVLRLLRGEDLETLSRALGVTAASLSGWQDAFLAAGEAS